MDLSKLSSLKGFLGALEFSPEGKLIAKAGSVNDKIGMMLAELCSANMRMGNMEAHGLTNFSSLKGFEECKGFAVSGPSFSLCVTGNISVLVENSQVDFNEVFKALNNLQSVN